MSATVDPYKHIKRIRGDPFTPTFVKSSCLSGIYATRVQGQKILLENPARESRAKKERQAKRVRRRKHQDRIALGIIGRKEAKEKGVWRFDPAQARFELFLPLHHLWLGYMSELLGLSPPPSSPGVTPTPQDMPASSGMQAKLVKADFHGAIVTVQQSKNTSLLGLSGIVIHETENAFKVVTQKDKVKLLPKYGSIFTFAVPLFSTLVPSSTADAMPSDDRTAISSSALERKSTVLTSPHIEFTLYGNQFRFRSAERAGRKFKHKETIEL